MINTDRQLLGATTFQILVLAVGVGVFYSACGRKVVRTSETVHYTENGSSPEETKASANEGKAEPLTMDTVPMPEGAKLVMTARDTRTIMLRGANDLEKVKHHFETRLGKLGWQKDLANSEVVDGVGFLEFKKGDLKVTVTLNPDSDGQTMAYILQGSGIDAPEEEDGDEAL